MSEQSVQRFLTKQFIDLNPIVIQLIPVVLSKNSRGALVRTPQAPRVAQTFRLIPLESPSPATPPVITDDGRHRNHDAVLLGEHNALMAVGDTWTDVEGYNYEIVEIAPDTPLNYERRGLVLKRGRDDSVS